MDKVAYHCKTRSSVFLAKALKKKHNWNEINSEAYVCLQAEGKWEVSMSCLCFIAKCLPNEKRHLLITSMLHHCYKCA